MLYLDYKLFIASDERDLYEAAVYNLMKRCTKCDFQLKCALFAVLLLHFQSLRQFYPEHCLLTKLTEEVNMEYLVKWSTACNRVYSEENGKYLYNNCGEGVVSVHSIHDELECLRTELVMAKEETRTIVEQSELRIMQVLRESKEAIITQAVSTACVVPATISSTVVSPTTVSSLVSPTYIVPPTMNVGVVAPIAMTPFNLYHSLDVEVVQPHHYLTNPYGDITLASVFMEWFLGGLNQRDFLDLSRCNCNVRTHLLRFTRMICYMKLFLSPATIDAIPVHTSDIFTQQVYVNKIRDMAVQAEQSIIMYRTEKRGPKRSKISASFRGAYDCFFKKETHDDLIREGKSNCRHIIDNSTKGSLQYTDLTNEEHFKFTNN